MLVSVSETSSDQLGSGNSEMCADSAILTYEPGAILTLKAHDLGNRLLTVRVLKLYEPFSFSCVMKVEILHGLSNPDAEFQRVVLKLYDRRFAEKLRREHGVCEWTPEIEERFVNFVSSGSAAGFWNALQQPGAFEQPDSGWNEAETETYLQSWCSDTLATELETYEHLKELQGHRIPRVFSQVTVFNRPSAPGVSSGSQSVSHLLQTQGFLMEHIVGPTFTRMPDFVAEQYWQELVDDALDTVATMSDLGVLNEGTRAANIIASPVGGQNGPYKAVLFDLAQCSIRQSHQSDSDWANLRLEQDEENALARTMSSVLRQVGFNLRYAPAHDSDR